MDLGAQIALIIASCCMFLAIALTIGLIRTLIKTYRKDDKKKDSN